MTTATTLESKETVSLIASDKVEGTAVYGTDDKKIGKLERVMIDKISGKVAYAVLSFGGFLGMGEDYYPMPWSTLKYNTSLGGYRVALTKDQLAKAPKYNKSTDWNWNRDNDRRVYDYYKAQPYWPMPKLLNCASSSRAIFSSQLRSFRFPVVNHEKRHKDCRYGAAGKLSLVALNAVRAL